jgi:D-threonate/D-erythronate kinase
MSAAEMLIVADDLSGAADCAIACVEAGLESLVVLGADRQTTSAEALAVDTDSRRLPAEQAAAVSAAALRAHAGADTLVLFKKFDSTLRGNVAAEVAACVAVARARTDAERATAIVAPAFPATGRTTRDGQLLVRGVRVEETEVWRREGITGRGFMPAMMASAGLRAASINLATIRAPGRLAQALLAASEDHDALVCDAETDGDLQAIAEAGQVLGPNTIWTGSAGLARHVPKAAGLTRAPRAAAPDAARPGAVICVVGSLSGISREQFGRLAATDGIAPFTIAPEILRAGAGSAAWAHADTQIDAAIAAGQDIAILVGADDEPDHAEGLVLCEALGLMIADRLASARGLVATGGETARALLRAIDVAALRLAGAVEPGIPLSFVAGTGAAAGLPVITKAGAFGVPESLLRCRDLLRAGASLTALPCSGSSS